MTCEIIPVREEGVRSLDQVLSCRGVLPTVDLGLPLGASTERYLSKGGKEVLIKSTLSSIPTYFLSFVHAPSSVTGKLERIQKQISLGRGGRGKEMSLGAGRDCHIS